MDSLLAIKGKDFVIMAADTASTRSIMKLKGTDDKIMTLADNNMLMGIVGPIGDRAQFGEFIDKNLELYFYRNRLRLSTHAAANFTRRELATALRRAPYQVWTLLAGLDLTDDGEKLEPKLYFMDYLASLNELPFAAHGYCSYFLLSILDRHYKTDLSIEEAMELLEICFKELETRFILNSSNFVIKIVDKDGVRVLRGLPEDGVPTTK